MKLSDVCFTIAGIGLLIVLIGMGSKYLEAKK